MNKKNLLAWSSLLFAHLAACATPVGDDWGADDDSLGSGGSSSASGGSTSSGGFPPATGGTPPSGGSAATGGTSTSGGAPSGCGTPGADPNFQALYKAEGTQASTDAIQAELRVFNNGPPVPISSFKLRYYFTSESAEKNTAINWTQLEPGGGSLTTTATVVPLPTGIPDVADYYVEFTFSGTPTELTTSTAIKFSWKLMAPNPHQFNQTNDYSFDATKSGAAEPSDTIVVLKDDVVVWGTPPC